MRQRIGELWIALGIFHLLLIAVLGHQELGGIVTAGLVDGLSGSTQREAAFWLFYLGVPFILIGLITRWAQQRSGTVPASLGWASVISGLLGWIVVPASGFPLVVALGVFTVRVARQQVPRSGTGQTPPDVPRVPGTAADAAGAHHQTPTYGG